MYQIPLVTNENQTLNITLLTQQCTINVYQKRTGVYLDLTVNGNPIMYGQLCVDRSSMIKEDYLGFNGRLMFVDLLGNTNPVASGFNTRYILVYLEKGVDY